MADAECQTLLDNCTLVAVGDAVNELKSQHVEEVAALTAEHTEQLTNLTLEHAALEV